MNLNNLILKHTGETIYVIGSGPSLRFFPGNFLESQITIGLNLAYKSLKFKPTYNLTIHPELIDKTTCFEYTWITKKKDWLAKPKEKHIRHIYFFQNQKEINDMSYVFLARQRAREGYVYVGRGIHTAGAILAAVMGARTCVLAGVDLGAIGDDHHATGQSVRFHGMPPEGVYREYYFNLRRIRSILRVNYGMSILTLSPFLGLHHVEEEYNFLQSELGYPKLPKPTDTSAYKRDSFDFTS